MKTTRQDEWIDDGHTIVSMNVEGMPWYQPTNRPKETVNDGYTTWMIIKESWKAAVVVCTVFSLALILTMAAFLRYTERNEK